MKFLYLLLLLPLASFAQNQHDTISIASKKKAQAIIFLQQQNCSICFEKIETQILKKYDTSEADFYFAWIDDADTAYAKRNQQLLNNNFAILKIKQHLFIERHTYLINGLVKILPRQEYKNFTPYGGVIEKNELVYYFPK